ncbi:hypothetical protein [Planobispora longispora]|uniref:hypothetical protein n=1 Tax=Planobispora longispora TaxID=28887 RepID=UPI001EF69B1F|nr:hypothetical protein [Planobispora longispora]
MTVLVLCVLGVVAGVSWSLLAPRPPYAATDEGAVLADPSTQALIAADGWFAVVTGAFGLACGALGYALSRKGSPLAVVLGLVTGGLVAAYLTMTVGGVVNLGAATVTASGPGASLVPGPLKLTAPGVLVAWPMLAAGLFFALEAVAGYRESPLRRPLAGQDLHGPPAVYDADVDGR